MGFYSDAAVSINVAILAALSLLTSSFPSLSCSATPLQTIHNQDPNPNPYFANNHPLARRTNIDLGNDDDTAEILINSKTPIRITVPAGGANRVPLPPSENGVVNEISLWNGPAGTRCFLYSAGPAKFTSPFPPSSGIREGEEGEDEEEQWENGYEFENIRQEEEEEEEEEDLFEIQERLNRLYHASNDGNNNNNDGNDVFTSPIFSLPDTSTLNVADVVALDAEYGDVEGSSVLGTSELNFVRRGGAPFPAESVHCFRMSEPARQMLVLLEVDDDGMVAGSQAPANQERDREDYGENYDSSGDYKATQSRRGRMAMTMMLSLDKKTSGSGNRYLVQSLEEHGNFGENENGNDKEDENENNDGSSAGIVVHRAALIAAPDLENTVCELVSNNDPPVKNIFAADMAMLTPISGAVLILCAGL